MPPPTSKKYCSLHPILKNSRLPADYQPLFTNAVNSNHIPISFLFPSTQL